MRVVAISSFQSASATSVADSQRIYLSPFMTEDITYIVNSVDKTKLSICLRESSACHLIWCLIGADDADGARAFTVLRWSNLR